MASILAVIYISFIALGLPDGMIGSLWPAISSELNIEAHKLSYIVFVIQIFTIISCLSSAKISAKYSTATITYVSVLLTSIGLFLFSISGSYIFLLFSAIPLGVGAGNVDTALNSYVARNFSARHMNILHAFWGVGALFSPFIVGALVKAGFSWRVGYVFIASILFAIFLLVFLSRRIWNNTPYELSHHNVISNKEALSIPYVKLSLLNFLFYSSIEITSGVWLGSYVFTRGLSKGDAAILVGVFFAAVVAGRLLSGMISVKLNNVSMIRCCQVLFLVGSALMLAPNKYIMIAGIILAGFAAAPIYPSILHETPKRFGKDATSAIISLQIAISYISGAVFPLIFGFFVKAYSVHILPYFLIMASVAMILMSEYLNSHFKKTNRL